MPERVTIRKDLRIIQIDSYGTVTAGDMRRSLEEVAEIHREQGLSRVFVDATQETSLPSTLPLFEFGSALSESLRVLKFAVAVAPTLKDDFAFLEDVTRNRGMQVRMFDSSDAALAWLLEEPDS
jgi:hypothetical protein